MTIAILATGDEIIHGDTLNTNGHNMAHALSSESMPLGTQLACRDKEKDIVEGMQFLSQRHDILIIIGGLGPTSDDRTRFALARFLNIPLIEHEAAIAHILARLTPANLELNQGNRQQAYFPSTATLLPNPHGTALGCSIIHHNKLIILLPGPPIECLTMFTDHVLPRIRNHQPRSNKQLLKWRLFGASEGMIAETLDNALKHLPCETGYRLERPYLEFKVICASQDTTTVSTIIDPILKPYIIATPKQRASECLQDTIAHRKQSVSIMDEATGGLLQTLIQHPSNYAWLRFQNDDHATWHFHLQGLSEYWQQKTDSKTTHVTLHYRNEKVDGEETHTLPYYGPWVVNSAAEWLAFRMVEIIRASC